MILKSWVQFTDYNKHMSSLEGTYTEKNKIKST